MDQDDCGSGDLACFLIVQSNTIDLDKSAFAQLYGLTSRKLYGVAVRANMSLDETTTRALRKRLGSAAKSSTKTKPQPKRKAKAAKRSRGGGR